jgi:hypothetical protein
LLFCHHEYAENGTVELLCERLPFDVIGCTTMGSAVNSLCGLEQMSLAVLGSDDVCFSTAISEPITPDNVRQVVTDAYRQARDKLPGEPSLILALPPVMQDMSGDVVVKILDELGGGTPVFGTVSCDSNVKIHHRDSRTLRNGGMHRFTMPLAMLHGKITTRFISTSIADRNIQKQVGTVTSSSDYTIKSVNNKPLVDYLADLGVRVEEFETMSALPLMVDYRDGTKPVALIIYRITADGATCAAQIPEGAGIAIAEADYNSVLDTAESSISQFLDEPDKSAVLIASCLSRCLIISPNAEDELEKTKQMIGDSVPFLLCYSGGEICPLYNGQGQLLNRFHNMTYTLVVLA